MIEYEEKLYREKLYRNEWIWWGRETEYRFRFDPIPRIGIARGNFGHWYKRPKTTQERRKYYGSKEYVRGRRHACNLPNAWDDYPRSDNQIKRSWK